MKHTMRSQESMRFFKACRACDKGFTNEKAYRKHMKDVAPLEYTSRLRDRIKTTVPWIQRKREFTQSAFGGAGGT